MIEKGRLRHVNAPAGWRPRSGRLRSPGAVRYARTYFGPPPPTVSYPDGLGFSLKPPKFVRKAVKSVKRAITIKNVAKVAGIVAGATILAPFAAGLAVRGGLAAIKGAGALARVGAAGFKLASGVRKLPAGLPSLKPYFERGMNEQIAAGLRAEAERRALEAAAAALPPAPAAGPVTETIPPPAPMTVPISPYGEGSYAPSAAPPAGGGGGAMTATTEPEQAPPPSGVNPALVLGGLALVGIALAARKKR